MTTHVEERQGVPLRARFESAMTLDAFIQKAEVNKDLWLPIQKRSEVAPELVAQRRTLSAPRYLLALAEDWCGDAINTLPVVAALADPSWFWPRMQRAMAELVDELGVATFPQNGEGDIVFQRMSRETPQR